MKRLPPRKIVPKKFFKKVLEKVQENYNREALEVEVAISKSTDWNYKGKINFLFSLVHNMTRNAKDSSPPLNEAFKK